ncbi:MAG: hypothetical protein L0154_00580 [Chloroflexi bacterium]|nr:hypothetical protein [Chloroflexota bacterium]
MGRVINTNTPGKRRGHLMRTIAEIMRQLGQREGEIDDEVRDMVAMIIFCLREIDEGIIESIQAWEKRGYWKKADKFQQEWDWAGLMAQRVEKMVRSDNWDSLPEVMMKLFPHFADIEVNKMTRSKGIWDGCYDKLMEEAK